PWLKTSVTNATTRLRTATRLEAFERLGEPAKLKGHRGFPPVKGSRLRLQAIRLRQDRPAGFLIAGLRLRYIQKFARRTLDIALLCGAVRLLAVGCQSHNEDGQQQDRT